MKIIKLTPAPSGAYPPLQSWDKATPPKGYAIVPDELDTGVFYAANGFVSITVEDGVVSKLDTNEAAKTAWEAAQPEEEAGDTEISTEELLLEMTADQEARICALELGV